MNWIARLFTPHCTVDPVTRKWIDDRLSWLDGQFADDPAGLETILPTSQFFPEPYDRSDKSVRLLVDRVCSYMGVDPEKIRLEFFENKARNLHLIRILFKRCAPLRSRFLIFSA